jgi:hypothetical protein
LLSSVDKLQSAFNAAARAAGLLLRSISTSAVVTVLAALVLSSLVSGTSAKSSAISMRISSFPVNKITTKHCIHQTFQGYKKQMMMMMMMMMHTNRQVYHTATFNQVCEKWLNPSILCHLSDIFVTSLQICECVLSIVNCFQIFRPAAEHPH